MTARKGYLIAIGALIAIAASAITALAVRAGVGAGASSATPSSAVGGPRDTVTVIGEGTQHATPDNAELNLGVSTKRGSAKDAMNAASAEMTSLLKGIKASGVAEQDIQTTSISVNQESNGYAVTGYRAANVVNVKIHHLDNVGLIVAAAAQAVGDDIQLNGISLQLSDNTTQLKGARQAAMSAAAGRAKVWAELAGRHLGKVLSVSEVIGNAGSTSPCGGSGGGCGGGGGTPVQAGQAAVTVDVAVVYELTD